MIDFQNAAFLKLMPAPIDQYAPIVSPILIEGEQIISCFKGVRDGIVFTTKRIIAINIQGITGKKKDLTSLPYSKIQTFSVETAGTFDLESELELWFSGLGKARFEFMSNCNVSQICKVISQYVLK